LIERDPLPQRSSPTTRAATNALTPSELCLEVKA
jgi:hypothetical protein